jgi:hypothetical protein
MKYKKWSLNQKLEIEESHLLKKYMQPLNFRQQICVSKKEK